MTEYLLVLFIGVISGVVSGVIGTGASIMLLPVLVLCFGPKQAVPIMAVAAIVGNISRVILWRKDIHWKAFLAYSVTGVPAAAFGAQTLWSLKATWIDIALGTFFLLMIPYRHWAKSRNFTLSLWQLSVAGALVGYLTGIVLSTGPLTIPIFSAYGLLKGPLLSTEAAASFVIYLSKTITFKAIGGLPLSVVLKGLLIGLSLAAGMSIGKFITLKISMTTFQRLLDVLMLLSGISLIAGGLT
ncbi:MAG: sulfite exporter TauE/SafE family protein [Methylococcales bacterium]